jgi:hypothetical protein
MQPGLSCSTSPPLAEACKTSRTYGCRANLTHVRQSRLDSSRGFHVKVLEFSHVFPLVDPRRRRLVSPGIARNDLSNRSEIVPGIRCLVSVSRIAQSPPSGTGLARIARGQMDRVFVAFSSHRKLKPSTNWTRLVPIFEFVPESKRSVCPLGIQPRSATCGMGSTPNLAGLTCLRVKGSGCRV